MISETASHWGLSLSTYRPKELGPDAITYFQFEAAVAALSICFFRTTVYSKHEPSIFRWIFASVLSFLAYHKKPYELIFAVEVFSYAASHVLFVNGTALSGRRSEQREKGDGLGDTRSYTTSNSLRLFQVAACAVIAFLLTHLAASGAIFHLLRHITPGVLVQGLKFMFPVDEMAAAYRMMSSFAHPVVLQKQISHLLFVTIHIQIGMGFLGIDFLRREQDRRNQLVRMDVAPTFVDLQQGDSGASNGAAGVSNGAANVVDKRSTQDILLQRAKNFQKTAPAFILFTALPYMFQIIVYGNVNKFAFTCVQHDLHRTVRLNELFDHDNHLLTMSSDSATSPEAYANSMNKIMDVCYEIWNRKLFSLPKILLLPGVMSKQPMLVVQVFPVIFISDWIKAIVMSAMTAKVEDLEKELQDLRAVRSKVESFDIKNAELLQRSGRGATHFTQRHWEEFCVKIQSKLVISDLITRSKLFFSFIQRNFIFSVLIDCALANLMAIRKIVSADTFVFSRAIEDTVDLLLMRSRAESDLARMQTEINKLGQLAEIWERSKTRSFLHCTLPLSTRKNIVLRNLVYSRGTAHVRADHIELVPGVYALTGSNGSGKSTLFRILMACDTNDNPIDLPPSINLLTPMEPLVEEDDIRREVTCEGPANVEESDLEVEISSIGEIGGPQSISQRRLDQVPHPRLAISMPSGDVVEISQNFYWPLYSRPIDWIYKEHVLEEFTPDELRLKARRVAEELRSLDFFQSLGIHSDEEASNLSPEDQEEEMLQRIISELLEEKEDWFSDLSGGQKSKCELVRKVLLHDTCPDVLLIDETMAPLDPASKALVMRKLKAFCRESVVIVIYHTDVGRGTDVDGKAVECVPSNDFFEKNIHLDAGVVYLKDVC